MREYRTEQRKLLLTFFRQHAGRSLSADDLLHALSPSTRISRSAVYRNLDRMAREGLLEKTLSAEGRRSLYQYAKCEERCDRIHLRCERCGRLLHLKNESADSALTALLKKSGFDLNEHSTVLNGVCGDCR